jgi:predicted GNAT superfamily acetyltransferase
MIRDAALADFESILQMNAESEHYLNRLTIDFLRSLHAEASYHRIALIDGDVAAFLIAFREGAAYCGEHYRWFGAHYARFLYVDRIVVRRKYQRRHVGSSLYQDVFTRARSAGVHCVACEIDVKPPNETSIEFHRRFGFREVCQRSAEAGAKTVSLQVAPT